MESATETTTVQVDENGRIALPQFIRDNMRIKSGTTLIVETTDENEVRLRVTRETAPLVRENDVFVIQAEPVGDIENAVENEREARIAGFFEGVSQQ